MANIETLAASVKYIDGMLRWPLVRRYSVCVKTADILRRFYVNEATLNARMAQA